MEGVLAGLKLVLKHWEQTQQRVATAYSFGARKFDYSPKCYGSFTASWRKDEPKDEAMDGVHKTTWLNRLHLRSFCQNRFEANELELASRGGANNNR